MIKLKSEYNPYRTKILFKTYIDAFK